MTACSEYVTVNNKPEEPNGCNEAAIKVFISEYNVELEPFLNKFFLTKI